MTKAVITDFDGVIRHWTREKTGEVESQCKLAAGTLAAICFEADLLEPAITGQCTKEVWFEQAHARLMKRYGRGVADHYLEAWRHEVVEIDHEMIRLYRQLFPNAQLALATNATSGFPEELDAAGLTYTFDAVFNSSAMGVAKPAKHYFYAVLMSLGLKAKDVLFIDDSLTNVQAARAMGIPSLHYRTRSELINALTDHALQSSLMEEDA